MGASLGQEGRREKVGNLEFQLGEWELELGGGSRGGPEEGVAVEDIIFHPGEGRYERSRDRSEDTRRVSDREKQTGTEGPLGLHLATNCEGPTEELAESHAADPTAPVATQARPRPISPSAALSLNPRNTNS